MNRSLRFFVAGLAMAISATNALADPRPALVEIANFDCPFCREMDTHHPRIEKAAERANVRFIYAPVPNDSNLDNAWRERVYYAARQIPGIERKLRHALLEAQDADRPVRSLAQVTAWLDMTLPEVLWGAFVRDHVESRASLLPIRRSIELAARAGVTGYPSFLIVNAQGIELIALSGSSIAEKADALVEFLESYNP